MAPAEERVFSSLVGLWDLFSQTRSGFAKKFGTRLSFGLEAVLANHQATSPDFSILKGTS